MSALEMVVVLEPFARNGSEWVERLTSELGLEPVRPFASSNTLPAIDGSTLAGRLAEQFSQALRAARTRKLALIGSEWLRYASTLEIDAVVVDFAEVLEDSRAPEDARPKMQQRLRKHVDALLQSRGIGRGKVLLFDRPLTTAERVAAASKFVREMKARAYSGQR